MSSNASGPPNPKRFRSNNGPNYPNDSENLDVFTKDPNDIKYASENIFTSFEQSHHFGVLKTSSNNCVVVEGRREDSGGGGGSGHLFSSPPYATAAVATNPSDGELSSNGDSGFQEFNLIDELVVNEAEKASATTLINGTIKPEKVNDETVEKIGNKIEMPNQSTISNNSSNDGDDDSISNISYSSDFTNLSGEDWKPVNNNVNWIQRQIASGADPKEIIRHLTGSEVIPQIDDIFAWRFLWRMLTEPDTRNKLSNINTIDDAIDLISKSSKIIVLTGAGVSVSCGIPDFRSRNGIYARLSKDYPDIPDPQSMFDIRYFKRNPYPFFKFAKEIYPGQFEPSASHKFIKYMEIKGKLLRNYSQNIDTLEKTAGIENVITCHGSFATATCTVCGFKVDSNAIKNDIFAQKIPLCPKCPEDMLNQNQNEDDTGSPILPVMKPDIVFFGEGLSDEFHNSMTIDKNQCDLLIVIGSSLKVRPVNLIPNSIPEEVPQILINREPLNDFNFDVELLGDCDVIIEHLCKRLGDDWLDYCFNRNKTEEEAKMEMEINKEYEFIPPSRYKFKGAELYDDDSDGDNDYDSSDSIDEDEEKNDTDELSEEKDSSLESSDISKELDNSLYNINEPSIPTTFVQQDSIISKESIDQLNRFNNSKHENETNE